MIEDYIKQESLIKAKGRCRKIDMVSFSANKAYGVYTFPMREKISSELPPIDHVVGEVWKPAGLDVAANVIEADGVEFLFIILR